MPYFPLSEHEDKKLYYIDEGKGDVLFLIHNWYQNGKICYAPYVDHFSEKYRVIIPDLPGHGRSFKGRNHHYSLKSTISILTIFLKQLKKEKNTIYLLGSSMGAYIALSISLRYPELAENLILISTLVDFNVNSTEIEKMLSHGPALLHANLTYRAVRGLFPFDGRKNKFWQINGKIPGKWKHYNQVMENHPIYAARDYMESFLDASIKEDFPKNNKPTLMIYGENDQLTPTDFASSVASKMPRGILRIIEGSGHHVYLKKPDRIFKLADEFLEEHKKRYFKWLKMFWRR